LKYNDFYFGLSIRFKGSQSNITYKLPKLFEKIAKAPRANDPRKTKRGREIQT